MGQPDSFRKLEAVSERRRTDQPVVKHIDWIENRFQKGLESDALV